MHRAWSIVDIQLEILERLEAQDLSRLARTCKALFNIATDELWKTLYSMSPFVCCLPLDFEERELVAKDVQRLYDYSQKVQTLAIDGGDPFVDKVIRLPEQFQPPHKRKQLKAKLGWKPWEELWREIKNITAASEFLPNLRRLGFNNAVEKLLIPLVGISGSNLNHIYIKYAHQRQPDSIVTKLLDGFRDTPNLTNLYVRDGEPDLVPGKLIKQSPLHHLRLEPRLTVHSKHDHDLYKNHSLRPEILEKSTLKHLTLGLTNKWFSTRLNTLNGKYLPNLRTLWLNLTVFGHDSSGPSLKEAPHDYSIQGRSPSLFLEGLDQPELDTLNIKFPFDASGDLLSDVTRAVHGSCRLQNLSQLTLTGGGWIQRCSDCGPRPTPRISPEQLRDAFSMLLPLPSLKLLTLSVAPNFLDVLDPDLYRDFASKLVSLEKLRLGHETFDGSRGRSSGQNNDSNAERVPLHHLAAFCCLLPNLTEVSVGVADFTVLEDAPRGEWACTGVKKLLVKRWLPEAHTRTLSKDKLDLSLRTYFPQSDLANRKGVAAYYIFE